MDTRILKLADNIVNYSLAVKKGEKVLIQCFGGDGLPLLQAVIREVYKAGGYPYAETKFGVIQREIALGANAEQIKLLAENDAALMSQMDCYIGIRGDYNTAEMSDVPSDKLELLQRGYGQPVHTEIRVPKTRWTVMRYPNFSMAQAANMSLEGFTDYYFKVCNLDYGKISSAQAKLVDYMGKTDKVRLVGPGTDLTFSIKGIPAINCDGKMNIPDGEVYTAPVRNSVNGVISFNTQSLYQGYTYENIVFELKDGKIVKATANDNDKINKILDTDEGARYIGEFAIGNNPYINKPMKDTLFDEKIAGSIHFTPGNAYKVAYNGNDSAIHWDLVLIQTPEYGGGEMYFDDVLVRKDGRFVVPELECLNPEHFS